MCGGGTHESNVPWVQALSGSHSRNLGSGILGLVEGRPKEALADQLLEASFAWRFSDSYNWKYLFLPLGEDPGMGLSWPELIFRGFVFTPR